MRGSSARPGSISPRTGGRSSRFPSAEGTAGRRRSASRSNCRTAGRSRSSTCLPTSTMPRCSVGPGCGRSFGSRRRSPTLIAPRSRLERDGHTLLQQLIVDQSRAILAGRPVFQGRPSAGWTVSALDPPPAGAFPPGTEATLAIRKRLQPHARAARRVVSYFGRPSSERRQAISAMTFAPSWSSRGLTLSSVSVPEWCTSK